MAVANPWIVDDFTIEHVDFPLNVGLQSPLLEDIAQGQRFSKGYNWKSPMDPAMSGQSPRFPCIPWQICPSILQSSLDTRWTAETRVVFYFVHGSYTAAGVVLLQKVPLQNLFLLEMRSKNDKKILCPGASDRRTSHEKFFELHMILYEWAGELLIAMLVCLGVTFHIV